MAEWSAVVPASVLVTWIDGTFRLYVDLSDASLSLLDADDVDVFEARDLPHGHVQHTRRPASESERSSFSRLLEAHLDGLGNDVAAAEVNTRPSTAD